MFPILPTNVDPQLVLDKINNKLRSIKFTGIIKAVAFSLKIS